jgi:polyribonucleotide nucleotidyltransferase
VAFHSSNIFSPQIRRRQRIEPIFRRVLFINMLRAATRRSSSYNRCSSSNRCSSNTHDTNSITEWSSSSSSSSPLMLRDFVFRRTTSTGTRETLVQEQKNRTMMTTMMHQARGISANNDSASSNDRRGRIRRRAFSTSSFSQSEKEEERTRFDGATRAETIIEVGEQNVSVKVGFESGALARLTDGAVVADLGDTVVLCTAVASREKGDPSKDFVPLLVDYRERAYAKGSIPPTFTRREGAPKDREILAMRVIDRTLRPLFPKGWSQETMIQSIVLASDLDQDPAVLCVNACSAALTISSIPWDGPIGACRVAVMKSGSICVNPTFQECDEASLVFFYAGNYDRALMIEAHANDESGVSEKDVARALLAAHDAARALIEPQLELKKKLDLKAIENNKMPKAKQEVAEPVGGRSPELRKDVLARCKERLRGLYDEKIQDKHERGRKMAELKTLIYHEMLAEYGEEEMKWSERDVDGAFFYNASVVMREMVLEDDIRVDGRGMDDIRDLRGEVGVLPSVVHGSSVFERGSTQALAAVTLGAEADSQKLDSLVGPSSKRLMLHYSFPSFSVNESGPPRGVSRREVGHGALAEKALAAALPDPSTFPFAVRINAETLESNGSSSMAAVCSGSLALFDAGVPLKEHVGALSVGLVMDEPPSLSSSSSTSDAPSASGDKLPRYKIMTDLMGLEDVLGDMDFKIAGTRSGITAIQLDCKPKGIPLEILIEAMNKASVGRAKVIDVMEKTISTPSTESKVNAPRSTRMKIHPSLIGKLIGPGGSVIKGLEKDTGAKVAVLNDDGEVEIFAKSKESHDKAFAFVESIRSSFIEIGTNVEAVVVEEKPFGVILELPNGDQGLMHVSNFAHTRTEVAEGVFTIGEKIEVQVVEKDMKGNVKFSRKALLPGGRPGLSRGSSASGNRRFVPNSRR